MLNATLDKKLAAYNYAKLIQDGYKLVEIAKMFGCSKSKISMYIDKDLVDEDTYKTTKAILRKNQLRALKHYKIS